MMTGLGHGLGVGVYAFCAVLGVAVAVESFPGVSRGIEGVGGLYLLWMGVTALRKAGAGSHEGGETSSRSGFIEGFTIAFLNPKIAIFFLALLGASLPEDATALNRAGVAGLAMGIDVGWYVFAALALATTGAAGWLRNQGAWVDRVLGASLLLMGAYLIVKAMG